MMEKIKKLNEAAFNYISSINPNLWANYPLYGESCEAMTYFHSTSNIVEQEMFRLKKLGIRFSSPYMFFKQITLLWARLYAERVKIGLDLKEKRYTIAKYALDLVKIQEGAAIRLDMEVDNGRTTWYRMVERSDGSSFIDCFSVATNFEINTCECGYRKLVGVICCHLCAERLRKKADTNQSRNAFLKSNVDRCWLSKTYRTCYKPNFPVVIVSRPLLCDNSILAPKQAKGRKGRPKTKRFERGFNIRKRKKIQKADQIIARTADSVYRISCEDSDEETDEDIDPDSDSNGDENLTSNVNREKEFESSDDGEDESDAESEEDNHGPSHDCDTDIWEKESNIDENDYSNPMTSVQSLNFHTEEFIEDGEIFENATSIYGNDSNASSSQGFEVEFNKGGDLVDNSTTTNSNTSVISYISSFFRWR